MGQLSEFAVRIAWLQLFERSNDMGLYDDDKQAVTGGDVLDVIYWQTKFSHQKLEAALKTRQPEGAVKGLIPSVINGANDVLKEYPNHADVKGWLENARRI